MLALAVSPAYDADRTVFAGIAAGGLLRSTDGGDTWRQVADLSDADSVRAIWLSDGYAVDRTLLVGLSGSVFRSTDGGESWSEVTRGRVNIHDSVRAIAVSMSAEAPTVFAGPDPEAYSGRSTTVHRGGR